MKQYKRLSKRKKIEETYTITSILGILGVLCYLIFNIKVNNIYVQIIYFTLAIILPIFWMTLAKIKGGINRCWLYGAPYRLIIRENNKDSIIEIKNINKETLEKKIKEFQLMYHNKNIKKGEYNIQIKTRGTENYYLVFTQPIEFNTFALRINYFSFLDEKSYKVTGWYPVKSIDTLGSKQVLCKQNSDIMIYCQNKKKRDIYFVYCNTNNGGSFTKSLDINNKKQKFYKGEKATGGIQAFGKGDREYINRPKI